MLEKARGEGSGRDEPDASRAPSVSTRFEALAPPVPGAGGGEADPFAPPPAPDVVLEIDAPERAEPAKDQALAAEIDAMAARRDQIGVAAVEPRYPRAVDRLAALIAVGPIARWSPRARVLLVAGIGAAAVGGLFFVGGIGPRVLQGALVLLLFALFVPS